MAQPIHPETPGESDRYHVPNVGRALLILEHLAEAQHPLGVSEIAETLDLPKNSVFRILTTLHAYGYLKRENDTKRYAIGSKLLSLAHHGFHTGQLVEQSVDVLRQVRDDTDESAFVGVIDSAEGVILEQVLSKQQVKVVLTVGSRFPLHTAAPAKAYLALLDDARRDAIVDEIDFNRYTDHTVTDRATFIAQLEQARRDGYAFDWGEHNDGIRCVGAAIQNQRSEPIGVIWVTGPSFRMDEHSMQRHGKIIRDAARRISQRFGYDG